MYILYSEVPQYLKDSDLYLSFEDGDDFEIEIAEKLPPTDKVENMDDFINMFYVYNRWGKEYSKDFLMLMRLNPEDVEHFLKTIERDYDQAKILLKNIDRSITINISSVYVIPEDVTFFDEGLEIGSENFLRVKEYVRNYVKKNNILLVRGDIINFLEDAYRNEAKFIWNGENIEHLSFNLDPYGALPKDYIVDEKNFSPTYWINIIAHNIIYFPCEDYRRQVVNSLKYDREFDSEYVETKEWNGHYIHRGKKHYLFFRIEVFGGCFEIKGKSGSIICENYSDEPKFISIKEIKDRAKNESPHNYNDDGENDEKLDDILKTKPIVLDFIKSVIMDPDTGFNIKDEYFDDLNFSEIWTNQQINWHNEGDEDN